MPKSTPNPTNRTANAIDSKFSEPTIMRPSAVLNGRELFVGDRNRSGQPDPRPIFACEIEILGRLSDGIGRLLARFQGIEVQDGAELDEGASVGIGQRF